MSSITFEHSLLAKELFTRTLAHPILGELVQWVPAVWLLELANPFPAPTTDLGNWGSSEQVTLAQLFESMRLNGMRDPFIIGVGRVTRTIRLEAGNQRVRCMVEHKVPYLPAVAYVGDSAVTHLGNGTHQGRIESLKIPNNYPDIMGPYPVKQFLKLSDVLTQMPS